MKGISTPKSGMIVGGVFMRWFLRRLPKRERRQAIRELDALYGSLVDAPPIKIVRITGPGVDDTLTGERVDAVATWEAIKATVAQDLA